MCSLGSGSAGNAWLFEARDGARVRRILVDDGFSVAQLVRRLARVGLALEDLDAFVLTHEHSDHVGGAAALLRRRAIPLWASRGTAYASGLADCPTWQPIEGGQAIDLDGLELVAFEVPHDAAEPLQFVVGDGERRIGLVTDLGFVTENVLTALAGVDGLVLECNHDVDALANGSYPAFLKQRIAGPRGHLSNRQAAELLARLDRSRLAWVAAAHLSRGNNHPQLARRALAEVLGCAPHRIAVACQDEGLGWHEV